MESPTQLRILCLEDNPLIAFHVEQMIEDLGHMAVRTIASFDDLMDLPPLAIDCALIDIDLADGRTGPDAARWLGEQGIPCIFVTGQQDLADANAELVVAYVGKPASLDQLERALAQVTRSE